MNSLISFGPSINLPEDIGFATYFTHLLKTKTCTDATFILETPEGEIEIFAHQLILAMRSPYFADKFYCNQRNKKSQVITLKRVNPKAFEDMIRYCYGCKPALETAKEVLALFKVASEFKITSLMNGCRAFLRDTKIAAGNVFYMLEVSEKMEDKSLRDRCNKVLEDRTKDVIESYDLRDVTPFMVHIILNLPKLSLYSEYELMKWIFEWAKVKSVERDSSCGNPREYLEKLLQEMSFLSLTFEEFASLCKDHSSFFTSDEIASVYLNIAFPGSREMPDWYNNDLKNRVYTGSRESNMEDSKEKLREESIKLQIVKSEKPEIEESKESKMEESEDNGIESEYSFEAFTFISP